MLPKGLKDFREETEEGIRGACVGYTKIPPVGNYAQQFNVRRPVPRILISLMLWAKYKHRLVEDVKFAAGIMTEDIRKEMNENDIQYQCRKYQQKAG